MPHFVKGYGDPEELSACPLTQPEHIRTFVMLACVRCFNVNFDRSTLVKPKETLTTFGIVRWPRDTARAPTGQHFGYACKNWLPIVEEAESS
jgi:hypothetical protein